MSEVLPVESIRAAALSDPDTVVLSDPDTVVGAADPSAVAKFEAAMATPPAEAPAAIDPIPFASQAAAAWRNAQVGSQDLLHRIRALTAMGEGQTPSAASLLELQYDVANLAFHQEIVTKVAEKASTAVQTLIKNQ